MSEETTTESNDAPPASAEASTTAEPPPKQVDRTAAIVGAVVGLLVGVGVGAVIMMPIEANQTALPGGRVKPAEAAAPSPPRPENEPSTPSFAQQGEDIVMMGILAKRGIKHPTYVDVGAHEPVISNNTYWFYKAGGDGVLVEPNPTYAAKLRAMRPRDTVLEVGVGVTDANEADYYVFDGDGQLNTFSKKQADIMESQHRRKLVKTLKRKLMKLNEILEQNFKKGSPHVLSVDAEGMDYEILKTVDWKRWRPLVVCVETADPETGKVEQEILDLMKANHYDVRGGSEVNTIFVDADEPAPGPAPSASAAPAPSR